MKKLLFSLLVLLGINTAVQAQGYPTTVCVNLSGPQPSGPIVLALTYSTGGVTITVMDTLNNTSLPATHCFAPYMAYPDSGFFAFTYGTVSILNCGPTFSASYQGSITAANTFSVNLQYCGNFPACSASVSQTMGTTILTATGTGVAPFQYSWDGGITFSSNNTYTAPGPGNYCVLIADANGCTATDCYTISGGGSSCNATITANSGPFGTTLTASMANSLGATYLWNTGEVTQSIVVTTAGIYCVVVSDTMCTDTACYTYSGNPSNCGGFIVQNVSPGGAVTLEVIPDSNLTVSSILWNNGVAGPVVVPSSTGTYCATIAYTNGCSASVCYTFTSGGNNICSAFASVIPDSLNSSLFYFFAYPNGTAPFTYDWIFSDGTSSNLANPIHTFMNTNGNDWAFLTITDATGCVSFYSVPVPTQNTSCSVPFSIQANYQTGTPGEVFFSATMNGVALTNYQWVFDNGDSSNTANPSTIYTSAGYYYVCLTVDVPAGPMLPAFCTSVYCQSIYIDPAWWGNPPFGGNCTAGFMVLGGPSGAGIVNIVNTSQGANLVYAWTVSSNGSNAAFPFFTIAQPGVYPICLTILDTLSGCTDTFCDTITVDSLGNVSRNSMSGNVSIVVHQTASPENLLAVENAASTQSSSLSVVPNPTNGMFAAIMNSLTEQQVQIDLFSVSGQKVADHFVKVKPGSNRIELNHLHLVPGTYSLRMISEAGVESTMLVVQP